MDHFYLNVKTNLHSNLAKESGSERRVAGGLQNRNGNAAVVRNDISLALGTNLFHSMSILYISCACFSPPLLAADSSLMAQLCPKKDLFVTSTDNGRTVV
jgi:hypothetical protein